MLGRNNFIRMFEESQFEIPYLAMLKYLLLRFKVCLSIKLTADLHLIPVSETRNYPRLLCAIHGNTATCTRVTNMWETVTITIFTLPLIMKGTGGYIFRQRPQSEKETMLPWSVHFQFLISVVSDNLCT
jgi:hypothetical protein